MEGVNNVVASGDDTTASTVETTTDTSTVENKQPKTQSDISATSAVNDGQTDGEDGGDSDVPKSVPYERFSQKVQELNEYKQKAELWDKLQKDPSLAESVLKMTAKNAPQRDPVLERADEQLKSMRYVKADDVQQMIAVAFAQREFVTKMQDLAKVHDGSDGNPRFEYEKVANYMDKTGISDPEQAYKVMYLDNLADNKAKQKRGTPFTERQGAPMSSSTDSSKADLDDATQTGNWTDYLLKRIKIPK